MKGNAVNQSTCGKIGVRFAVGAGSVRRSGSGDKLEEPAPSGDPDRGTEPPPTKNGRFSTPFTAPASPRMLNGVGYDGASCAASSLKYGRSGDDVAFDGDLDEGPVPHLGNDFVAPRVDDDGVSGCGPHRRWGSTTRPCGVEDQVAVRPQEYFAWRIADQAALVVERPFVGMVKLFIDPLGAAEDLGDDCSPGREKKMQVASTMVARE